MRIGIIGAGPAGTECAAILGEAGIEVLLFDYHGAWEKPCGGGVTYKALHRYPFLSDCLEATRQVRQMEVVSPQGRLLTVPLHFPFFIYSRQLLNRILLERAISKGAQFCQERVQSLGTEGSGWRLGTDRSEYRVDFLVGADGVNSLVRRRLTQRFAAQDLMMTYGYRLTCEGNNTAVIKFFPNFPGYLWAFPRAQGVSYGICAKLGRVETPVLKARFHDYLEANGSSLPPTSHPGLKDRAGAFYSALLPSLRPETFRGNRISGANWALVGDAAGFADPVTGEGIYYALRSGQLLAEVLLASRPDFYPAVCQSDFVSNLICGAEFFEKFYTGDFLGSSFIDRMVQFSGRSKTLRQITNAFVAGQQPYKTLRSALLRRLPKVGGEMLRSIVLSS